MNPVAVYIVKVLLVLICSCELPVKSFVIERVHLVLCLMDSSTQGDCKALYACALMSEDRCSVHRLIRASGSSNSQ